MRRGLICWSQEEVPASTLDLRVARLVHKMRAEQLDAVLIYTSFARPAAVSWLIHFVPYWGECLLAVFPDSTSLIAAYSKRGLSWIRVVSHVGDVATVPNLGAAAVDLLSKRVPGLANGQGRVGVVELDKLPLTVAEPLVEKGWGEALVDASALFASVRQPADEAEIGLARHALRLASMALDAVPDKARRASDVLSIIERTTRSAGAEEVMVRLAPDLATNEVLQRIESDAELGDRYAVQVSLAYKGTWVRLARSLRSSAPSDAWLKAERWFADAAAELNTSKLSGGPSVAPPSGALLSAWSLEACLGTEPFYLVAQGEAGRVGLEKPLAALPSGSLAVLSVQLATHEGAWHAAAPVVLGGMGKATRLLNGLAD